MVALIVAGLKNIGTYWWSDKPILRMYRALSGSDQAPALWNIVRELAT